MRLPIATIACFLALAAAGTAVAAAPNGLPPAYEFMLIYERGGGLAPSTRSLVVAPAQFAMAETSGGEGGKRHAEFRLGGRRILKLERGLRRAHFHSLESPGPSGCADCFEYSIFYYGHLLEFDQSQIPPRLGAVIADVEAIITDHTARRH